MRDLPAKRFEPFSPTREGQTPIRSNDGRHSLVYRTFWLDLSCHGEAPDEAHGLDGVHPHE